MTDPCKIDKLITCSKWQEYFFLFLFFLKIKRRKWKTDNLGGRFEYLISDAYRNYDILYSVTVISYRLGVIYAVIFFIIKRHAFEYNYVKYISRRRDLFTR